MPTRVLGLKELERAMGQIPVRMQQNVLRSGNRALAMAVVKEIRNNPGIPMTVRRAVTAAVSFKLKATRGYIVGLRSPFWPLAHLIEFGTVDRTQRTTGRYTGRMPANPFLRPAIDAFTADKATQIWAKAASRNFERQMKKLAAR